MNFEDNDRVDRPKAKKYNEYGKEISWQCPCDKWISPRGYFGHNSFCDDYQLSEDYNEETLW